MLPRKKGIRKERSPASSPCQEVKSRKTVIKPDSRREKSLTAFKDSLLSSPPGNKPLVRSRRPKNGFLPGLPSRRLFDSFLSSSGLIERSLYVGGHMLRLNPAAPLERRCLWLPRFFQAKHQHRETNLRRTDAAG